MEFVEFVNFSHLISHIVYHKFWQITLLEIFGYDNDCQNLNDVEIKIAHHVMGQSNNRCRGVKY